MSKQIKQMEMDALRHTLHDVRDLVVLSSTKLTCQADHTLRSTLRKKSIRVQMVKNSLARRVLGEMGVDAGGIWEGTTMLVWGSNSLAELSKELETLVKKNDKFLKVKGAVSEGQPVRFDVALKMPTRPEAIGRVIGLALSPASRLISQILAPAANVAGQIKTLSEKPAELPVEKPAEESVAATPA